MSNQLNTLIAIGITIFLLSYMTNNVICGIFIILILLFLYKYKYKYNDIIKDIVNVETPNNNDKHYNDNIMNSLDKIKKYKKYNLNDYHEGMKYFHKYMDTIHTLENRNLKHHRQYIENAKLYLNRSINHFQNITYSVPDRKLLSALKYNDFSSKACFGSPVGSVLIQLSAVPPPALLLNQFIQVEPAVLVDNFLVIILFIRTPLIQCFVLKPKLP